MFARSGILWLALVIFPAVTSTACIEVNGGAAELSWTLRDFEGKRIKSCEDANIAQIRLAWKAVDAAADASTDPDGERLFPCEDSRGITKFVIPEGQQMFWIQPICRDQVAPSGSYEAPPPIVRDVAEGTVTTLDSLLIVADPTCTCPESMSSCATSPVLPR